MRDSAFEFARAESSGYCMIDTTLLNEFVMHIATCKKCGNGTVCLEESFEKRSGPTSVIAATCDSCGDSSSFYTSNQVGSEVNPQFAYALRSMGKGRQSGAVLCALVNMPPPSARMGSYKKIVEAIRKTAEGSTQAAEVRELAADEQIAVTVDGTWTTFEEPTTFRAL